MKIFSLLFALALAMLTTAMPLMNDTVADRCVDEAYVSFTHPNIDDQVCCESRSSDSSHGDPLRKRSVSRPSR